MRLSRDWTEGTSPSPEIGATFYEDAAPVATLTLASGAFETRVPGRVLRRAARPDEALAFARLGGPNPLLSIMELLASTRANIAGAVALIFLAALLGATVISQPLWRPALEYFIAIGGGFAVISRFDGDEWTPWSRSAMLGAAVTIAGAIGLITRMVVHGLLK